MRSSAKDRAYATAGQISAERRPTVSTALAGVSSADAPRYLKECSQEKNAVGGQIAAAPAALLEQAARLAGACSERQTFYPTNVPGSASSDRDCPGFA